MGSSPDSFEPPCLDKVLMLEGRGHSIYLSHCNSHSSCLLSPARDRLGDFIGSLPCLSLGEAEVFCNAQSKFKRSISVLLIDEGRENSRSKLNWNRVQIVSR